MRRAQLLKQKAAYRNNNREILREAASKYYDDNKNQFLYRQQMAYQTIHGRAKHLWNGAKYRATRKGISFRISLAAIERVLSAGRCQLTELPFDLQAVGKQGAFSPTLHRVDASRGYTPRNTRVVVWAFNTACGQWPEEQLWQIVAARWPNRVKARKA